MRHRRQILAAIALVLAAQPSHAQYAAIIGAYKADDGRTCRVSDFHGTPLEDPLYGAVCVPWVSFGRFDTFTIQMAIAELTDPALMQQMLIQNMLGNTPVSEAYEVAVDSRDGDVFDLADGTVLRARESFYVGYLGYHEDAILFRDGSDWHFCVDGEEFEVEILRDRQTSYNRRRISGTRNEILTMDACR